MPVGVSLPPARFGFAHYVANGLGRWLIKEEPAISGRWNVLTRDANCALLRPYGKFVGPQGYSGHGLFVIARHCWPEAVCASHAGGRI